MRTDHNRSGVTLVEVIFSMGVILIGLLGVMSILPLAGERARDAVGLGIAPTIGDNIMEEMLAQRWLSSGRLVAFDLPPNPPVLVPITVNEPFCIDPAFFAASPVAQVPPGTAYDSRFFPFYRPRHDPTLDPSVTTPVPGIQLNEPLTRMRRVGLLRRPVALGNQTLLTTPEAFFVADSPDDLLIERPQERTANPFRFGTRVSTAADGLPYGGRFGSGEFSWIATVTANPVPGYATVSVVVIRNRQRSFQLPTGPASGPINNATDERVATISFASGFRGGAGGVVELNGAINTVSRLRQGDWILLSRAVSLTSVENLLHRWYRVAALEGDPERLTLTREQVGFDTNNLNGREVWRRKVYLDGPDFTFRSNLTSTGTLATLVEGVVSVTEHVVQVSSL